MTSQPAFPFHGRGEAPLVGAYAEAGDLVIEGGPTALRSLARLIRDAQGSLALNRPATKRATPYDGFLDSVVVRPGAGKIVIARDGEQLTIHGDSASRAALAENVESLAARAWQGDHLHVEYHRDHFYLAPSSGSLVITVQERVPSG